MTDAIHAFIARTCSPTAAYGWLSPINQTINEIARCPDWRRIIDESSNRDRVVGSQRRNIVATGITRVPAVCVSWGSFMVGDGARDRGVGAIARHEAADSTGNGQP